MLEEIYKNLIIEQIKKKKKEGNMQNVS